MSKWNARRGGKGADACPLAARLALVSVARVPGGIFAFLTDQACSSDGFVSDEKVSQLRGGTKQFEQSAHRRAEPEPPLRARTDDDDVVIDVDRRYQRTC